MQLDAVVLQFHQAHLLTGLLYMHDVSFWALNLSAVGRYAYYSYSTLE